MTGPSKAPPVRVCQLDPKPQYAPPPVVSRRNLSSDGKVKTSKAGEGDTLESRRDVELAQAGAPRPQVAMTYRTGPKPAGCGSGNRRLELAASGNAAGLKRGVKFQ